MQNCSRPYIMKAQQTQTLNQVCYADLAARTHPLQLLTPLTNSRPRNPGNGPHPDLHSVKHGKREGSITHRLTDLAAENKRVLAQMKRWKQDARLADRVLNNEQIKLSQKSGLRAARKLREANTLRQAIQQALARAENTERQALEMAQTIADLRTQTAKLLARLHRIQRAEEKTR